MPESTTIEQCELRREMHELRLYEHHLRGSLEMLEMQGTSVSGPTLEDIPHRLQWSLGE